MINGKAVFLDEPIEETNWTSSSVGLLSPYYKGYIDWDNFRAADEEYTLTTQAVFGCCRRPTRTSSRACRTTIPDKWEYEGTAPGGRYEWYIYFKGEGVHGYKSAKVYFSPRLMVEDAGFPDDMNAGSTVQVPIDWENLSSNQPARLYVILRTRSSARRTPRTRSW